MSECNHDCENCGSNCGGNCDGNCDHGIKKLEPTADTKIGKIVGILSGKGGVGKSMVSSLLAVELARKGYKVGILDADITGPSIQKVFGIEGTVYGDEEGVWPLETELGIRAISMNMLLESEETPVLWRGPVITGMLTQFYTNVHWGELDYLLIDMPPGTGDVALSILQQMPVDGLVMVTSPSKLVGMIVGKTINLASAVKTKVYGLVENMSYVKCPDCGKEIMLYKEDGTADTAGKYGLGVLAKLPIDPELSDLTDNGRIEEYDGNYMEVLIKTIEA